MKLLLSSIVTMIVLALSTVTFAQNTPPAGTAGPGSAATDQMTSKPDKQDKDKDKDGAAEQHSNKGGELRGLDRADEAAGEHGQQGRERARENMTQSERPSIDGGGHGRR